MNKSLMIIILLLSIAYCLRGQSSDPELLMKRTIEQNQEIEISVEGLNRIEITFQNVIDKESVVYRTSYAEGKEQAENIIGPKQYRTNTLAPKIKKEDEVIRLDRKEIVLDTGDADKIIIRVVKGKVDIQAKSPKKRM